MKVAGAQIDLDRSDPTPLYHQIERQLADQIQRGRLKPGSRLLPAREMQRRLDVNFRTVLTAYSRLQRRGLVHSRQGSGTVVLEPAAKKWVGLLLFDPFAVETSPFYRLVASALHNLLEEAGYALKLYVAPPGSDGDSTKGGSGGKPETVIYSELLEDLREHAVQGLVIMKELTGSSVHQALSESRTPHVRISVNAEPNHCGVSPDMLSCVQLGLDHLIRQGRKQIAMMSGVSTRVGEPTELETWGYETILKERGLKWSPLWLHNTDVPTEAAGYQAVKKIWSQTPVPDGLLIADDVMAKGACTALAELGVRVPDDLSLAVHANKGSGIAYPVPVTRVRFDPHLLAKATRDMLVQMIDHETLAKSWVSVPPKVASDDEAPDAFGQTVPSTASVELNL